MSNKERDRDDDLRGLPRLSGPLKMDLGIPAAADSGEAPNWPASFTKLKVTSTRTSDVQKRGCDLCLWSFRTQPHCESCTTKIKQRANPTILGSQLTPIIFPANYVPKSASLPPPPAPFLHLEPRGTTAKEITRSQSKVYTESLKSCNQHEKSITQDGGD